MKTSELIKNLREMKKKHGDLPVTTSCTIFGRHEINCVEVWTEGGNRPDGRRKHTDPAVEIELFYRPYGGP